MRLINILVVVEIKNKKIKQLISFVICFVVMAVIAVVRDGQILGHKMRVMPGDSIARNVAVDTMYHTKDNVTVINTTSLAKDVTGFGGTVPLEIYLKDGKILKIKALKNHETPEFFEQASKLLTAWNGKFVDEAQQLKVDAISGATFSSRGIIGNVERGLQYAAKNVHEKSFFEKIDLNTKTVAGLIVVLLAAVVPLFYRKKTYRTIQQILNVAVLGFWCGTFISYALMVGYLANGVNVWASLIPIMMLVTAFIYPLFGKKNYYCTNICPCGSLQELAGKINKRHRWRMSTEVAQALSRFREILWAVLLMLMLLDVTFKWMDYEIFSAFIIQSASWCVLVLGIVFLILSFFVPRPYCRFLCPTGTLFKVAQNSKL